MYAPGGATSGRHVVGVDGAGSGWVAVALADGRFLDAVCVRRFPDLLARHAGAAVIAVDIPIGLPDTGWRPADVLARRVVGPARTASVFLTPPRAVLEAPTYAEAVAVSRRLCAHAVSRQAWGLRRKIMEVEAAAAGDPRVVEVHPEVCFTAMGWGPVKESKTTCSTRPPPRGRRTVPPAVWRGPCRASRPATAPGAWSRSGTDPRGPDGAHAPGPPRPSRPCRTTRRLTAGSPWRAPCG